MWSIFLIQEKQTDNLKGITDNKKTNYQGDNLSNIALQIRGNKPDARKMF
jgi:hypothetical protein